MNENLLSLVESPWRPYTNFPSLKKAGLISFDVETYDPNLEENGPGALRGDGYIIGFSIATNDGFKGYYPLRHEGGDNLENPDNAIKWAKDQLKSDIPKIGANILYDLIWLKADLGISVGGLKYDVQIAEPLLNENKQTYTLDSLAVEYLKVHKTEDMLLKAGELLLGLKGTGDTPEKVKESIVKQVKGKLWRLPARYVGSYGEDDADLPIKIFKIQAERLKNEGLWKLFNEVETPLVDLLLAMWIKGVPIDIDKGEEIKDKLQLELDQVIRKIKRKVGFKPNIWAQEEVVKCCETLGIFYPYSKKGNPSFEAKWLKEQSHDFFKLLLEARQLDRGGSVFIEKKILDLQVAGRIHPQFWQVKSERYGTASGRFSSSNPNAQQFPARNERLAKLIRSILIAEKGKSWGRLDYSQQEPRVTVHYASLLNLKGANRACEKYNKEPDTDYHQWVKEMIKEMANLDVTRRVAKDLNLGLAYGMGKKKMAITLGLSYEETMKIYDAYHQAIPFIKLLGDRCQKTASQRGVIKTLLGRKQHFDLFGPPEWREGIIPKLYEEAIKEFGRPVQRYFLHKAMNRLIQGGSADMIKKAMLDSYNAGYIPCLTVHDELDYCDIESDKQLKEIKEIMLNAIKLKVPMVVDVDKGENWGELEKIEL